MFGDHPIDDPVLLRFLGAHEVVALGVLTDLVELFARVLGDDLVEPVADVVFAGVVIDVSGVNGTVAATACWPIAMAIRG